MQADDFIRIAETYLTLRQRGDLSDARTIAHNALLDALTAAGIAYEDREHAARIAADIVERPVYFDELTEVKTMIKPIHPVANIFPMMQPDEFQELTDDIRQNGLREKIWLHPDGRIIDGRNRYKACLAAGVTPEFQTWSGNDSLVAFVVSLNLKRRHLNSGQRASVALEMLPMLEEEAKERQRAAGGNHGNQYTVAKLPLVQNFVQAAIIPNKATSTPFSEFQKNIETKKEQEQIAQKSVQKAAELTGTNRQYISDMKRYKDNAPDVYDAMRSGRVNGNQAKALSKVEPAKRKEYIEKVVTEDLSGKEIASIAKREEKSVQQEQKRQDNLIIVQQSKTEITKISDITQRFSTLAIDPPWDWGDEGDVSQFGRARPEYATMTIDQIAALPIANITERNAHIYLWITNRSLPKGFALLEAWGFRYITCLTWCKPSIGMGNYFRGSSEQLLFGVKGSLPLQRHDVGTWFAANRPSRHSEKPQEAYAMIESCSPPTYIELFARQPRQNWFTWGGEL